MKLVKLKKVLIKFSFLLPALLIFAFVVIAPFISGIGISLTNWNGISSQYKFVGLRNLFLLLTDDSAIIPVRNTLFYTALTVVFVNLIGLLLALGFNVKFKGVGILKSALFSPIVTSLILASFVWSCIYIEVFPKLFGMSGLLGNPSTVIPGIAMICVWRDSGLAMVIYIAALQCVPEEMMEAAKIDGANVFQRLFNVTLPLMAPAFTTCITLWLGWGLKIFDYPMAATGGGPGRASETFAIYVYKNAFPYNKAGYGQMAAIVMMIVVVGISGLTTSILRRRELEL